MVAGLPLLPSAWALRPQLVSAAGGAAADHVARARAPLADPAAVRRVGQHARRRGAGRRPARRRDGGRAAALADPPRARGSPPRARALHRAAAGGPRLPGDPARHRHLPFPVGLDGAHPRRADRGVAVGVSAPAARDRLLDRRGGVLVDRDPASPRPARRWARVIVGRLGDRRRRARAVAAGVRRRAQHRTVQPARRSRRQPPDRPGPREAEPAARTGPPVGREPARRTADGGHPAINLVVLAGMAVAALLVVARRYRTGARSWAGTRSTSARSRPCAAATGRSTTNTTRADT